MLLLLLVRAIHLGRDGVFSFLQVVIASVGDFDASAMHVNHERVSAYREWAVHVSED